MSLWKFNDFEREVDFTDADFLDRLEDAKKNMNDQLRLVPKTGKNSDIIRSQVACYRVFYDTLFGEGAGDAIMGGKTSLNICLEATDSLLAFEGRTSDELNRKYEKYMVQNHGNRQQRRKYNQTHKNQR
ncbi:DUF6673 family protein [Clostridium sp. Marseille-P3244]|uniref:DUF6673 family protein n=1 Tax=Clostridium sp. Marseille-P3244 TaxID=1871020 RepID=UPI00093054EB|nr:DUF6673 family protein [Clostridium sp. Marseille-P3244]